MSFFFAAILGACLGSFANVVALRWHEGSDLVERSRCPHCRKTIRARHLVPILSWLWLRGRCADCGKRIHYQYPLVEGLTAVLFVVAAGQFNPFGPDVLSFIIQSLLILAFVIFIIMDVRWQELPLELMIVVTLIAIVVQLGYGIGADRLTETILRLIFGLALPLALLGGSWFMSRGRWLGYGDVWIGLMMGAILGWPLIILALWIAFILGGLVAVACLISGRSLSSRIPFGPILIAGCLITLWCGECLLSLSF